MKIYIIKMLRNRLQSTCMALMGFGEVITSEESVLQKLRLRCEAVGGGAKTPAEGRAFGGGREPGGGGGGGG